MFDKKINFPTDLIQELAIKFLDPKSVLSASKVSKSWNRFFSHPTIWKKKLIQDFGIDSKLFSELHISEDNQLLYKQIYTRLYMGAKHHKLPDFVKAIFKGITDQKLLLLYCLDNTAAFENVAVEEHYSLVVLSIYTGGFHLPVHFLQNNNKEEKLLKSLLDYSLVSRNFPLVKYLLNPENQFKLKPNQETLDSAVHSGNLKLVQYFLNPKNKFELKPNQEMLDFAAGSGNLQLVQYLLNPANQFGLEPNQFTLNRAVLSENFELSERLLPTHVAMQEALQKLRAGNFILAMDLLQQSQIACPSHYKLWSEYVLNNAKLFKLNDEAIQLLEDQENNSSMFGLIYKK